MKYQFKFSSQLLDAIYMDSKIPLSTLQVDGGMTGNNLLMQLQADIVGIPVGETLFTTSVFAFFLELCRQMQTLSMNTIFCCHR